MPTRLVREGILTSEAVNGLNWAEEVFYRRLLSVVDDFGRYYASPKLLRAACYPLHIDKVSDSDIGKWLAACATAALVRVYPAQDGKTYLEVLRFNQQVRAKASKFPQPSDKCVADAQQMPSTREASVHLGVSVSEGVSEGGGGKRATRIPPNFEPTPEPEAESGIDRQRELANFRDYWTAKSGANATKLDWQATWRQWARKADRPGVSRFAKPDPTATVPSKPGRDPELTRLEIERSRAVPMPANVREAMEKLKQGATA